MADKGKTGVTKVQVESRLLDEINRKKHFSSIFKAWHIHK